MLREQRLSANVLNTYLNSDLPEEEDPLFQILQEGQKKKKVHVTPFLRITSTLKSTFTIIDFAFQDIIFLLQIGLCVTRINCRRTQFSRKKSEILPILQITVHFSSTPNVFAIKLTQKIYNAAENASLVLGHLPEFLYLKILSLKTKNLNYMYLNPMHLRKYYFLIIQHLFLQIDFTSSSKRNRGTRKRVKKAILGQLVEKYKPSCALQ